MEAIEPRRLVELLFQAAVYPKPSDEAKAFRVYAREKDGEGRAYLPEHEALAVEAYAAQLEALDARLAPGTFPGGDKQRLVDALPVGQCDGVFYLGSRPLPFAADAELRALRYLKPMPQAWMRQFGNPVSASTGKPAGLWIQRVGVQCVHGWEHPSVNRIIQVADAEERAVKNLFHMERFCCEAVQPKYQPWFRFYRVEPDIWAVLYAPPQVA